MRKIRRILVGLDLSPKGTGISSGSLLAAEQALWLARTLKAKVSLVHSTHFDEFLSFEQAERFWAIREGMPTEGNQALQQWAERFRDEGLQVDLHIDEGKAWVAIVKRVLHEDIDLVMIGTRSHEAFQLDEQLLGSVAMKLLRNCPCSVWVCRPGSEIYPKTIVAATDLSPAVGHKVLEYGAFLAEQHEAQLHVVHAYRLSWSLELWQDSALLARKTHEREEVIRATLREMLQPFKLEPTPRLVIKHSGPAETITSEVDRIDPDVVVMGTVSRSGISGILVGNTAERLMGRIRRSMLTVKPADFVTPVRVTEPPPSFL